MRLRGGLVNIRFGKDENNLAVLHCVPEGKEKNEKAELVDVAF